ncbi:MAG: hypothetical protein ACJA1T_000957 [Zhongshania aliphaticivorans]|jgi:hypothetical protein
MLALENNDNQVWPLMVLILSWPRLNVGIGQRGLELTARYLLTLKLYK